MFSSFGKVLASAVFALLSVSAMSSLNANECCECYESCNPGRMYIGAFGGGLFPESTHMIQQGTALFEEAKGGPLSVLAEGDAKGTSTGFGGVQVGYEWLKNLGCSDWSIGTALEAEAFFYSHKKHGHLMNLDDLDRLPEHDFDDHFKVNSAVILVNAVLSLNSPCMYGFTPYIGGGIGAARLSMKDADSLQVAPLEPGINHFNSKNHDASWAFAAQAKAGLRYNFCEKFHIFAEYRYLYIDFSNYIFGSTVYPTHAHTTPWNVKVDNMQSNAFAIGIQFDL